MSYSIFSYKRRFSNLFKSIATKLKFKTILGNNTALCLRKVERYSTVSHLPYILVNTLQLLEGQIIFSKICKMNEHFGFV